MPDISMCQNEDCPKKDQCHRYTATPSPMWQSYSDFTFEVVGEQAVCRNFWPNYDQQVINGVHK